MDKLQQTIINTLIDNTLIEYIKEKGLWIVEYPFYVLLESDGVTSTQTPLLMESFKRHIERQYGTNYSDEVNKEMYKKYKLSIKKKKESFITVDLSKHRKSIWFHQDWSDVFRENYNPCNEIHLNNIE
jgi:hypothetical protein